MIDVPTSARISTFTVLKSCTNATLHENDQKTGQESEGNRI